MSNGALSGPAVVSAYSADTCDATGLALDPNSSYRVIFTNPAGNAGDARVDVTASTNFVSTAGWVFGKTFYSSGGDDVAGLTAYGAFDPPKIALVAASVPEPSALALAGLGGFSLLLARRKK